MSSAFRTFIQPKIDRSGNSDEEDSYTKVSRNINLERLHHSFLFSEMSLRVAKHIEENPDTQLINLGTGNPTHPIPEVVALSMADFARELCKTKGYIGYGPSQGNVVLRKAIADTFYKHVGVKYSEVFVSDGSQCDMTRLQLLMGPNVTIAVQDTTYPAFIDASVLMGQTGDLKDNMYENIVYMKCGPEENFFPDLSKTPRTDIICFCNPSNPTGYTSTRQELQQLVDFAKKNGSIIIFDAAYSTYIDDDTDSPRSIFEITGAKQVAIEFSSFSKFAGFGGVRLGWTIIPEELSFSNGYPVINDYYRTVSTSFCGASCIAQAGGISCLSPQGLEAVKDIINYYKENSRILKEVFESLEIKAYGGTHLPHLWVHFPGSNSWDLFTDILKKTNVMTTPGIGFGPGGENFIRVTGMGEREETIEGARRLKSYFSERQKSGNNII